MNANRLKALLEWGRSFDLEGHKIQPGLLAPPVVCASAAWWTNSGRSDGALLEYRAKYRDVVARRVCTAPEPWCWFGEADGVSLDALVWFETMLDDPRVTIIGANIAYDMACMAHEAALLGRDLMPKILAAYEAGRVYDVQIAEALHHIAIGCLGLDPRTGQKLRDPITRKLGRYSLSIVLDLVLGRRDAKTNDLYRTSFALLEDTPIEEWPYEARVYPVDDAVNTLEIALAQCGLVERPAPHEYPRGRGVDEFSCAHCGHHIHAGGTEACKPRRWANFNLHDVSRQAYAAFAMHLGAIWGFSVDPVAVGALETRVRASRDAGTERFVKRGFLRYKRQPNQAFDAAEKAIVRKVTAGTVADAALSLGIAEDEIRAVVGKLLSRGAVKASKHTAVIKRSIALAYGCVGACSVCAGAQKVPSAKSGKPVGCRVCDSTGLNLDSAPVPRTKGSKCRTCKSAGCAQCEGQPAIIPGCGTSRDAMSESGEEDLIDFAMLLEESKILETYIPFLRRGISDVSDEDEDENDEGESE